MYHFQIIFSIFKSILVSKNSNYTILKVILDISYIFIELIIWVVI
jgi:hypothetical protein